eukprot:1249722-Rhodomonas_salina.2
MPGTDARMLLPGKDFLCARRNFVCPPPPLQRFRRGFSNWVLLSVLETRGRRRRWSRVCDGFLIAGYLGGYLEGFLEGYLKGYLLTTLPWPLPLPFPLPLPLAERSLGPGLCVRRRHAGSSALRAQGPRLRVPDTLEVPRGASQDRRSYGSLSVENGKPSRLRMGSASMLPRQGPVKHGAPKRERASEREQRRKRRGERAELLRGEARRLHMEALRESEVRRRGNEKEVTALGPERDFGEQRTVRAGWKQELQDSRLGRGRAANSAHRLPRTQNPEERRNVSGMVASGSGVHGCRGVRIDQGGGCQQKEGYEQGEEQRKGKSKKSHARRTKEDRWE